MVHSNGDTALRVHRFKDLTVRYIHDYHAFHVKGPLNKLCCAIIDLVHRRADDQIWASMGVNFSVGLQTFSAKLFHLNVREFSDTSAETRRKNAY